MQMIRTTFDGMKRLGQIPQWADFQNPDDTRRAGEIHAEYLFDQYGGDARKAAAAYYGGEKAVKPDGSIAVFGDLKNSSAPSTVQYADAVMARMR
jgi:hypothetical protein